MQRVSEQIQSLQELQISDSMTPIINFPGNQLLRLRFLHTLGFSSIWESILSLISATTGILIRKLAQFITLFKNIMSRKWWKQIHRYFHIWDPALDHFTSNRTARPHEKVDPITKLLLSAFQQYWKPATDVTIDECIKAFTGRTADTVNIPTKPTPIRFKIWVLAD